VSSSKSSDPEKELRRFINKFGPLAMQNECVCYDTLQRLISFSLDDETINLDVYFACHGGLRAVSVSQIA
jgi:hypothetical protein